MADLIDHARNANVVERRGKAVNVIIKNMRCPDKCCKCPILNKASGVCPLLGRRVVDRGKRHPDCPMEDADNVTRNA